MLNNLKYNGLSLFPLQRDLSKIKAFVFSYDSALSVGIYLVDQLYFLLKFSS